MNFCSKLLNSDNPVFQGFLTYSAVLVLKMMLMSVLTSFQRYRHHVPASQEDSVFLTGKNIIVRHDDVERVCRAHRNDLENIPIFVIIGLAYVLTNPNSDVALNLFRAFTICRCVHTFVYAIVVVPQPARALVWTVAYVITGYMALRVLIYFCKF